MNQGPTVPMELPVYLDHAATTPLDPEALAEMMPFFTENFGNPSSIYSLGSRARAAVDEARESVADAIGARPEEIYFTAGGTEGDNWAVKGLASRGSHVLVSVIEHRAILEPAESLRCQGYDVELIPVDSEGLVHPEEVARRIREETAFVSVMTANNEVGTLQPISEIGRVCRDEGVAFHTDAVQALGKVPIDVREMNVDCLTLSAHKLYGPKGVGALFIRRGTRLADFMEGGEQEKGRRAGTLNVPGIVGFGSAVRKWIEKMPEESARLQELRDRLIERVQRDAPRARLMGSRTQRLPNNAHFCFEGVEGEPLLLSLDMAGVCASAGSACSAGSTEPSHVLLAMGLSMEQARGALRLTLGRSTTAESVDYAAGCIAAAVRDLRALT